MKKITLQPLLEGRSSLSTFLGGWSKFLIFRRLANQLLKGITSFHFFLQKSMMVIVILEKSKVVIEILEGSKKKTLFSRILY